jgi:hypothetical protein
MTRPRRHPLGASVPRRHRPGPRVPPLRPRGLTRACSPIGPSSAAGRHRRRGSPPPPLLGYQLRRAPAKLAARRRPRPWSPLSFTLQAAAPLRPPAAAAPPWSPAAVALQPPPPAAPPRPLAAHRSRHHRPRLRGLSRAMRAAARRCRRARGCPRRPQRAPPRGDCRIRPQHLGRRERGHGGCHPASTKARELGPN